MQRSARLRVGILAAVALCLVAVWLRYPGKAPAKLPTENCDSALWEHVYQKERLRVVQACTVVEGRVKSVWREHDGDLHIALDPAEKSVLNIFNLVHAHRTLVVEIICEHDASGDVARAACGGLRSQVTIPSPGDRLRVTGAYVVDKDNGWMEIHPVTRIEVLSK